MITLITELSLAEGVPVEHLHEYLNGPFSEQMRLIGPKAGVVRCIVSSRLADPDVEAFAVARGWVDPPESIVQLTLDSKESALAVLGRSQADSLLRPPALERLLNAGGTSTFAATERTVFGSLSEDLRWSQAGTLSSPVKMVVQAVRREGMDFETFSRHWTDTHAPLVSKHGPRMGNIQYVQSHRVLDPDLVSAAAAVSGRATPDGMAEVWWQDHQTMQATFATSEAADASAAMEDDEREFLTPTAMWAFLAREIPVLRGS